MESKDGDSVVRIRIEVVMTQRRIVDRQGLNHLLTGSRSPIGHFLEVLELTDTEAFGATQREDRHGYTGSLPTRLGTTESTVVLVDYTTLLYAPDLAVLTPFGINYCTVLKVIDDVFIFDDILPFDIDICAPNGEVRIVHHELVIRVPIAQLSAVTDNRYALRRLDLRQVDRETDIALRCFCLSGVQTMEESLHESGGIETVLVRAGLPCIANDKVLVGSLERQYARFTGLVDILSLAYADGVFIMNNTCEIAHRHISLPEISSLTIKHQRRFLGPSQNQLLRLDHAKTLPILGTIMNLKIDVHDIVFY